MPGRGTGRKRAGLRAGAVVVGFPVLDGPAGSAPMRITCPECGSVYDVPDRAVPDPGRDVQCAGCGASWFLLKGGAAASAPTGLGGVSGSVAGPSASAGVPPAGHETGAAPNAETEADRPPESAARPLEDRPPARRVDPDVLRILREEAETERRARAASTRAAPAQETVPGASRAAAPTEPATGDAGTEVPSGATVMASGAPSAQDAAGLVGGGAAHRSGARGRLARLTEAERQSGGGARGHGPAWDVRAEEADTGLVEDPDPARHGPRPPLLTALPPPASPSPPPLPALRGTADHGALVILAQRRRGFRLGFATTAGLCCAALGAYVLALNAGDGLDAPLVDAVRHHGGQVQSALVDWLRRVVVPALS